MPNLNPNIMRWARETAGLDLPEAAAKLAIKPAYGKDAPARLAAVESGQAAPTRPLLAKMAKQYRRPLIVFYLPDIPPKGDRGEDFRKLSAPISPIDAALVDAVVRDIKSRQILVKSSMESALEAEPLPFIGRMRQSDGINALVASIEKTLGFNREAFRAKPRVGESFAYLRNLAEANGVFVLLIDNLGSWHTTIKVEAFRGFALADSVAPFVAINANDTPSAWSFTLFHELAHLWLDASGLSGDVAERGIEKFCNDAASELLLPADELAAISVANNTPLDKAKDLIAEFARPRKVSRAMVAYKLRRAGTIDLEYYQRLAAEFKRDFERHKADEKRRNAGKSGGPSYYTVRKHRVGATLVQFTARMMHEGYLSVTKAGMVLGVGAHNVYPLINRARPSHTV